MSAQVQTPPKVDSLMKKTSPQKRYENPQNRKNYTGSGNSSVHSMKDGKTIPANLDKQAVLKKNFRKRCHSCGSGNKVCMPHKRRKRNCGCCVVPPTKFLLGGNINDPLNLNSLKNEEINRAVNATPSSSPLQNNRHGKDPIEVIIPRNYEDPLNLANDDDMALELMISPVVKNHKKQKKSKKKKRSGSSSGSGKEDFTVEETKVSGDKNSEGVASAAIDVTAGTSSKTPISNKEILPEDSKNSEKTPVAENTSATGSAMVTAATTPNPGTSQKRPDLQRKPEELTISVRKDKELKDRIVSPVIPQPGAWGTTRFRDKSKTPQTNLTQQPGQSTPRFNKSNARFQYGNYNRYYGYRNPKDIDDVRLKYLMRRPELFEGKDVLDVGCNVGHITLAIARDMKPKKIIGIDIDRGLIESAKKNMRQFLHPGKKDYPYSMSALYGFVPLTTRLDNSFPHNIAFVQGNYVLENDVLLTMEKPQFDTILCLSITKWLHLNWGDTGLKRAFKRMFAQLRPGGVLFLEPQVWYSYQRKRNLTEQIWRNYQNIEFFPHKFSDYLLSDEVGFSKCESLGAPTHPLKGFQRQIRIFTKGIGDVSKNVETERAEEMEVEVLNEVSKLSEDPIEQSHKESIDESSSISAPRQLVLSDSVSEKMLVDCDEGSEISLINPSEDSGGKSVQECSDDSFGSNAKDSEKSLRVKSQKPINKENEPNLKIKGLQNEQSLSDHEHSENSFVSKSSSDSCSSSLISTPNSKMLHPHDEHFVQIPYHDSDVNVPTITPIQEPVATDTNQMNSLIEPEQGIPGQSFILNSQAIVNDEPNISAGSSGMSVVRFDESSASPDYSSRSHSSLSSQPQQVSPAQRPEYSTPRSPSPLSSQQQQQVSPAQRPDYSTPRSPSPLSFLQQQRILAQQHGDSPPITSPSPSNNVVNELETLERRNDTDSPLSSERFGPSSPSYISSSPPERRVEDVPISPGYSPYNHISPERRVEDVSGNPGFNSARLERIDGDTPAVNCSPDDGVPIVSTPRFDEPIYESSNSDNRSPDDAIGRVHMNAPYHENYFPDEITDVPDEVQVNSIDTNTIIEDSSTNFDQDL